MGCLECGNDYALRTNYVKKKKMPFINKTPSHVSFAAELHILNLLK
jgi:hypothetical protein